MRPQSLVRIHHIGNLARARLGRVELCEPSKASNRSLHRALRSVVDTLMLGGVTANEVAFVVTVLVIVLLAPKALRVGETVGALFEKRRGPKA